MTLRESPPGVELCVTGVRLPASEAFRLNEMGIRVGSVAHVTQHAAFGGRVLAVAGSRYALDRGTAALIDVERVGTSPGRSMS
jgi:ferrous iron transport protein A